MSNEHHSLSGRWTAARGMSNSTAPDGFDQTRRGTANDVRDYLNSWDPKEEL